MIEQLSMHTHTHTHKHTHTHDAVSQENKVAGCIQPCTINFSPLFHLMAKGSVFPLRLEAVLAALEEAEDGV